jgi:hypothetical protein
MARAHRQGAGRTLVLASLPQCCVVCRGTRSVRNTVSGPIPCPHCVTGMPVAHLPWRQDIPRGAA